MTTSTADFKLKFRIVKIHSPKFVWKPTNWFNVHSYLVSTSRLIILTESSMPDFFLFGLIFF
jgi:hypothetical protein